MSDDDVNEIKKMLQEVLTRFAVTDSVVNRMQADITDIKINYRNDNKELREENKALRNEIKEFRENVEKNYVRVDEYKTLRNAVFGIGTFLITALLSLIIYGVLGGGGIP